MFGQGPGPGVSGGPDDMGGHDDVGNSKAMPPRSGDRAARPGRDPRRPPGTVNPATGSGLERRSPTSSRDNRAALRLIGLAVLGHMLRSRRFYERLTLAAILLVALTRLGRENRDITLARLSAWNKRQIQLLERKAERQAKRLGRKARALG